MARARVAGGYLPNPGTPKQIKAFLELGKQARRRRLSHHAKLETPQTVDEVLRAWESATKKGRWAKKHKDVLAGDLTWLAECWDFRSGLERELLTELESADTEVTQIHRVMPSEFEERETAQERIERIRANPSRLKSGYIRDEVLDQPAVDRHEYYAAIASRDPSRSPRFVLDMVVEWAERSLQEGWGPEYATILRDDLAWLSECYGFELTSQPTHALEAEDIDVEMVDEAPPLTEDAPQRLQRLADAGELSPYRPNPTVGERFPWTTADDIAARFVEQLLDAGAVSSSDQVVVAGSLRRKEPTVGDIDLLLVDVPDERWAQLQRVPGLALTAFGPKIARGGYSPRLASGIMMPIDIRRVDSDSMGAALEYFTGPKQHNIGMRTKAKRLGYKLNEYGLYNEHGDRVAGATEREIYAILDVEWKPPSQRGKAKKFPKKRRTR